jgi:hypothetical protein
MRARRGRERLQNVSTARTGAVQANAQVLQDWSTWRSVAHAPKTQPSGHVRGRMLDAARDPMHKAMLATAAGAQC